MLQAADKTRDILHVKVCNSTPIHLLTLKIVYFFKLQPRLKLSITQESLLIFW